LRKEVEYLKENIDKIFTILNSKWYEYRIHMGNWNIRETKQ
jgi:hypothetical protein